ncbi:MAG: purine-nucleoside phosphorylase [bacterium]|nr:purine-nucleoside phosphorylase [bacterium]
MLDPTQILTSLSPLFPLPPEIALILGSGLGDFADELEGAKRLSTSDLPGYPQSTVPGHQGAIISGTWAGKRLVCFQGRVHLYEGYSVDQVILPVQIAAKLGAQTLILTNASGGINRHLEPGSLMLITDSIDLQFRRRHPVEQDLRFAAVQYERQPFFPIGETFSPRLRRLAQAAALKEGLALFPGVLGAMTGPSYETPAEVEMERRLGVDAACMSTVAEAAEAARLGLEVLGISCITNRAAGLQDTPLNHAEVIETAARVRGNFIKLLKAIIERI